MRQCLLWQLPHFATSLFASRIGMHWEAVTFLGGRQDLPLGTCDISVSWEGAVARPTGQASVARKDVKAEAVELQACWLGGAGNRCRVRC